MTIMSNRDPPQFTHRYNGSGHASTHPVNSNGSHPTNPARQFNPSAGDFEPSNGYGNMSQVSPPSHYSLEYSVNSLMREQVALRTDLEDVKTLCNSLYDSVEKFKKGGWGVTVGPFKDQSAGQFKKQLDALARETRGEYSNANDFNKSTTGSVPPHLRAASTISNASTSVPPHLRGKIAAGDKKASAPPHMHTGATNGTSVKDFESDKGSANDPLVTDGIVDTTTFKRSTRHEEPTPPSSPGTTIKPDEPIPSVEKLSLNPIVDKDWKPHFLNTLSPLGTSIADRIPVMNSMTSFAPDFLRNTFGGKQWGPGLNFIPPAPGPCIIRNRSYYTVDAHFEPYLPPTPGTHGAKLVPFFNVNPEDEIDMPEECGTSTENVPLFVMMKDGKGRKRYFYFGHYSQTRWSDQLDYDHMLQCVPKHVREYWAEELGSNGRPEWITKKLTQHFFPKPEYQGRLFGRPVDEGGSVASEDAGKREEKVLKDVKKYVEALREWGRDAHMRTAMIKKEFILQAFDRADADDPPALRLWWEYLECIDWKLDFYDMLVKLQARNPNYERY